MTLTNITVIYAEPQNPLQKQSLKTVHDVLKARSIPHTFIERHQATKKHIANADIIIPVGGDGTFLKAAQLVTNNVPFLGVNGDPKRREGFLLACTKTDFEEKINKIEKGKTVIRKLDRLQAHIDNKPLSELALNEFYIASEKAYLTARYYLTIRGKTERQKTSGLLVATPAGSYAWVKSAGGPQLPLYSKKYVYVSREPYCGNVASKCSMTYGVLHERESVQVKFEVGNGILIADSMSKEYHFSHNQKIMVKKANKPISVYTFGHKKPGVS